MEVERLKAKNINEFKNLLEEVKYVSKYRNDYYNYYNNKSFLQKFLIRKLVKLIKVDDKYIGYIWADYPDIASIHLKDFYIKKEYFNILSPSFLEFLNSNSVYYETYESCISAKIFDRLSMKKIKSTDLLKKTIDLIPEVVTSKNITFSLCRKEKDAKKRCEVQNLIFNKDSRMPLSVQDIIYDEKTDYYIEDLCLFILKDNKIIGYGQIIYSRSMYMIVNFGVIEEFRNNGYGYILINKLISLAVNKGITELYVRVEKNNFIAKSLYYKVGFSDVGNISTWQWKKNLSIL